MKILEEKWQLSKKEPNGSSRSEKILYEMKILTG